jgi:uridine kinase
VDRLSLLNELAGRLGRLHLGRPVKVAVDGRTASRKTTLADELASILISEGRNVIRTSIDGFHRPRIERYARGRYSAEGYYYDARDHAAIVELLLAPLGVGGDRRYRTASFDLDADQPIEQAPRTAPEDAVLIVDGTFLQRPELRAHWDATVFVRTSEEESEARVINRDSGRLGSKEAIQELYAIRYRPAYALYESMCKPEGNSDAIIDNDDLQQPRLHLSLVGRLA